MSTEADTCRKFVVPLLQQAGWDNDPHSIAEQRYFTAGRIVSQGQTARRRPGKRADYLLRYTRDLPLAVVEAKAAYKHPADGLQQAKDYATILGLPFAYATNGTGIIEFDFLTGHESQLADFPTPADLWARYRQGQQLNDPAAADRFLTPFNLTTGKIPHYYQRIAIDRVIQAILSGQRRVLVTMATGTGKTVVAFQICWKLWSSRWNRRHRTPHSATPAFTASPASSISPTATSWWTIPRTRPSPPSATPGYKIEGGVTVLAANSISPPTSPSPGTNAAPAFTRNSRATSSTWSSWTSATAAPPGKNPTGAKSSNGSSPPTSSA